MNAIAQRFAARNLAAALAISDAAKRDRDAAKDGCRAPRGSVLVERVLLCQRLLATSHDTGPARTGAQGEK
jgi:hypothetical protein